MELVLKPVMNQKILLSPVMVQSLNLLEISTADLHSLLSSKQEKNPYLKIHQRGSTVDSLYEFKDSSRDFSAELMEQLLHLKVPRRMQDLLKLIVADLSEHGFLTQTPKEMAICFKATVHEIKEALTLLKQCEPIGIGSANLQEFLLLQSRGKPDYVADILKNYYALFLHQKWKDLSRNSGYPLELIKETAVYVSKMKTRPVTWANKENIVVQPDIRVAVEEDKPVITFYPHAFPHVSFDGAFAEGAEKTVEVRRFLKRYAEEVTVLQEQLELRKETLRKITEQIVRQQEAFFLKGPEFLKSMTMTSFAKMLNLHVSTVSRAVKDKYISTPYGTFAMRHFFSTSNDFLDETKMTVGQLKNYINTVICSEDKTNPISDQQLVNRLKLEGVDVSRRVIAKYRQQLNLPNSSKRKLMVESSF